MTGVRYLVLDLETSDFDSNPKAVPMEIGMIALNESFQIVGEFECPINVRDEPGEAFSESATALHKKTGLFQACMEANNGRDSVEYNACAWLRSMGYPQRDGVLPPPETITIGRNPWFDRAFTKRCLPELESFFHYRTIDVSTLVYVASIASGIMPDRLKSALAGTEDVRKFTQHRALADCHLAYRQLIGLAKHYDGAGLVADLRAQGLIG